MQLEGVCTVPVGGVFLKVARKIDDVDGLKRAFLDKKVIDSCPHQYLLYADKSQLLTEPTEALGIQRPKLMAVCMYTIQWCIVMIMLLICQTSVSLLS